MSDRGYINLIRHLTRTTSTLPLATLQASIAHYLARPPVPIPGSPTALTATVLGSPVFSPYTYVKLAALAVAFRHAVHLRIAVHKAEAEQSPGSILPPSRGVDVVARLGRWVRATLEGFAGSAAVIRLACASGMLLGLQDWEAELKVAEKEPRVRAKVEEEVVLALAEVVDTYAREGSGWEKDFKKSLEAKGVEEGERNSATRPSQDTGLRYTGRPACIGYVTRVPVCPVHRAATSTSSAFTGMSSPQTEMCTNTR